MVALRARVLALALVCLQAGAALAAEPPPPDVTHGERFDGRAHEPARAGRALLWVPRVLLFPLRMLVRGLAWPIGRLTELIERHHLVPRVLRLFLSEDRLIGVYPTISYTAGFLPTVGATFFDRRFIGEGTSFDLSLSGANSNNIFTSMSLRPTHELRAVEAVFGAAYNRRDDSLFTGIGDTTRAVNGSRYAIDSLDLTARVRLVASEALSFELGGMFGLRRFGNGRLISDDLPIVEVFCVRDARAVCVPGTVDELKVPGFAAGTQFLRGAAAVHLDTRDSLIRTSSGASLRFETQYSHGLGGDRSSYFRLRGGVEAALDLWERTRVLIVRLQGDLLIPAGDEPVPFSELVVLGGHDDLRGARPGRYRDFSSLLASIAYRWPIWMWMDAELFADYGGVFGRGYQGFSLDRMVPALGGGLRIRTQARFFIRAQTAYGFGWANGWQFFVSASTEP